MPSKRRRPPPAPDAGAPAGPGSRRAGRHPAAPPRGETGGQTALLFGVHAVSAAWTNPRRHCRRLWATKTGADTLSALPVPAGVIRPSPLIVEREALDALVGAGAVHQGLVLDAAPLPEPALDDLLAQSGADSLLVVLDQVTDPHNVGAILRSTAAFGGAALVVQDRHAPPVTGTLAKSASGAVEQVPIVRVVNIARALDALAEAGFRTLGLAEEAAVVLDPATAPAGRAAIVLGAEGAGLRRLVREHCTDLVRLPTRPPMASLNVSNAAAIALYALSLRPVQG